MRQTSEQRRTADPEQRLETREVIVNEPGLSQSTNERLTAEVRDVVGASKVTVPVGRSRPSQGEQVDRSSGFSRPSTGWLMTVIGAFSALVVAGLIVSSVTGSWWFVGLAFAIDVIGVATIALVVVRMTAVSNRPDPALVAAMQEEGILSPDQHFSQIVDEFREADVDGDEHRKTDVLDDPVAAAAEQRSATTPTGGRSKAVGL